MTSILLMNDFSVRPFASHRTASTTPVSSSGGGLFWSTRTAFDVSCLTLPPGHHVTGLSLPRMAATAPGGILRLPGGHLVLTGGNHALSKLMTGQTLPSTGSQERLFSNIRRRAQWCHAHGTGFHTWIFPDKMVALRHLMPNSSEIRSLYLSRYAVSEHFRDDLPVTYLIDGVEGDDTSYNLHDTHFSARVLTDTVCLMAAQVLGREDPEWRDALWQAHEFKADWVFELGRKFTPCLREDIWVLKRPADAVVASNGIRAGNDGIIELGDFPGAITGKTLLLFGDSFFRQLIDYFGFFFRRIVFCRTRFFHPEMVRAVKPDVIFNGLAERYLSHVADDSERPHMLAYPYMLDRAVAPEQGFSALWKQMIDERALANPRENGPDDL